MLHMDRAGSVEAGIPPSMMCSFFPMLGNQSRPMKGINGSNLQDQSSECLHAGGDLSSTCVLFGIKPLHAWLAWIKEKCMPKSDDNGSLMRQLPRETIGHSLRESSP